MPISVERLSLVFDETNMGVAFSGFRHVVGMTFRGSGLTPGQILTVRNKSTPGEGSVLADYLVIDESENVELWGAKSPQLVSGISMDDLPLAGAWALTVFFDGVE